MKRECEKLERLVMDYALGELDPAEVELVEEHVRTCPGCAEALVEVRQITGALSEQEMLAPSATGCESVREAVRESALGRRGLVTAISDLAASFVRRPVLAGATALVAVAAVVLALTLPGPQSGKEGPGGREWVGRSGTFPWKYRRYLSESKRVMSSIVGADAAEVLTSQDWKTWVAQAMQLREKGVEAYEPLLEDLEELYSTIDGFQRKFGDEEIRQIREFISGRMLIERTGSALRAKR